MDFEFQLLARKHSMVIWDKVFNELHNIWGNLCACVTTRMVMFKRTLKRT